MERIIWPLRLWIDCLAGRKAEASLPLRVKLVAMAELCDLRGQSGSVGMLMRCSSVLLGQKVAMQSTSTSDWRSQISEYNPTVDRYLSFALSNQCTGRYYTSSHQWRGHSAITWQRPTINPNSG